MADKLNQIVLMDYAIKGINADIDKLERSIRRGKQLLKDIESGISHPTSKQPDEIRKIIFERKSEIEHLKQLESDIEWQQLELKGEL